MAYDLDGGLLKKVLQEGTGDAKPVSGQEVVAHYTGTLDNGEGACVRRGSATLILQQAASLIPRETETRNSDLLLAKAWSLKDGIKDSCP